MPETVLVTGATGFVGGHVCRRLLAGGWRVRAAARRPAGVPAGAEPWEVGHVARADWSRAVEGVDRVVHLIALAHARGASEAELESVNVDGTRAVLAACAGSGVRQFLLMSSIKAMGGARDEPYTEEEPCRPEDPYGATKLRAERLVRERGEASGFRWTIVRPPLVYGPGVKGNLRALLRAIERGVPLPLAGVENRRDLVAADNLADATAWLLSPAVGGEGIFLVADGEPVSTPDLVRRIGGLMGRRPRLFRVPGPLLAGVAAALGRRGEIEKLSGCLVLSTGKIRSTGWRPVVDLEAGLEATVTWFRGRAVELARHGAT